MKSPFPGMDPYLEKYWGDVHTRLIILCCNQLQRQLPVGLRASVEETVRIDDAESDSKTYVPDVSVSARDPWAAELPGSGSALAVAEPVIIPADAFTDRHIEIVSTTSGHRICTVIEVLSPSNKVGEQGRSRYLQKRDDYIRSGTNVVEIDLLRSGPFLPITPEIPIAPVPRKTYFARVYRASWPQWEIYPIGLRDRLPAFRIPLRRSDLDVVLDLQGAIEAAYEEGAYERAVDYSGPLAPPLEADDAQWVNELVAQRGAT